MLWFKPHYTVIMLFYKWQAIFGTAQNGRSKSARISSRINMAIGSWEVIELKTFQSKLVLFRRPRLSQQNYIKAFKKLFINIVMQFTFY